MNENKKLMSGIKSKLLAAVCMLLVAVIMVVSSTYAWFTLSTAPEVTGITTAVGANGALEMLLLTYDATINDWVYNEGMVKDGDDKNTYWGNLVDLSSSEYGLSDIILYPSKLNIETDKLIKKGTVIGATLLSTPTYDSTGRVEEVIPNTNTGTFTGGKFIINEKYGVRAIGVSSGMTPRQLAYRNAKSSANTAMLQAKNAASQSLLDHGSDLASIAVKYALNATATYSYTEIEPLYNITDKLLADGGALEKIEEAYMNYIIAVFASEFAGKEAAAEIAYTVVQGYMDDIVEDLKGTPGTPAITTFMNKLSTGAAEIGVTLTIPTAFETFIGELEATIANVQEAHSELAGIVESESTSLEWARDISDPVSILVKTSSLEVNGLTVDAIKADKDAFVNKVIADNFKLSVSMKTGAGVFADIADHCGDYTANIKIRNVVYGDLDFPEIDATMTTDTSYELPHLNVISALFAVGGEFEAPESGDTADKPITEFYGYVIDLAFRTNASSSNLLLQTDAIDRIYNDNNNDETLGHGSSMTFQSGAAEFSLQDVAELMECLKVVFYEEKDNSNVILATAKLAVFGEEDADGNKEKLYTTSADGVTAKMYLYETNEEDGTETILEDTNAIIKGLTQNEKHNIHVLVYLDGEKITNADVAATGTASMTGKMNLQFASSAALVPMEYADLHQTGGSTSEETTTPTEELEYDIASPQTLTIESEYVNEAYTYTFSEEGWVINGGTITVPAGVTEGTEVTLTVKNAGSEEVVKYIITVTNSGSTGS